MQWDRDFSVTAYLEALNGVVDTVSSLREDEWPLPTDLPGWSVHDNVAHVIDIEQRLTGRPGPDHRPDYDTLSHVRNDFGRHTEVGVDFRRGRSPVELINELHAVVNERTQVIRAYPDDPDYLVLGSAGKKRPLSLALPIRAFDVWAHDQDIRRAIRAPERLTGPAPAMALERSLEVLPDALAKSKLPPEVTVRFVIDSPGPAPSGLIVTVAVDQPGSVRLVDDDSATADLTLTMPFAVFAHAVMGRRRPAADDIQVLGDAGLVGAVLDGLVITP